MGIPLASTFTMNAALPIDERFTVADITARDAIAAGRRYEGMIVYVASVGTNYQLIGGIDNTNWTELSGSGGAGGSGGSDKQSLLNNSSNQITSIGEYISDASCIMVDYYIYRRTDSEYRSQSGKLFIEGQPDAALSVDRWTLFEAERAERGSSPSGITLSLSEIDTDKSILVIDTDNMAGSNHQSTFFFKITILDSGSFKAALNNNAVNTLSSIGHYVTDYVCLAVDYYLYRRTDDGFKSMSGRIYLEAQPDAALNPDMWSLWEAIRSERGGDSGVTFSLDDVDVGKSVLVATLDDMTGANHSCIFYYNLTELSA